MIVASRGVRSSTAEASARSSCSSSYFRPTNGVSIRTREGGYVVHELEDPEGTDRLALALERERLDLLCPDAAADEALGRRADEDLARTCGLLETRADVHRVARGERLAGTGDDLAGVDADTRVETEGADGVAHLDRSANRAQRVVLVNLRQPEDRHRRVAHELLHGPTVTLEDRTELRVVAGHQLAQDLRVGPLAERGRADEVAEDDGDRLPDVCRGLRDQDSAAGATEPLTGRILLAAGCAAHHGSVHQDAVRIKQTRDVAAVERERAFCARPSSSSQSPRNRGVPIRDLGGGRSASSS